MNPFRSKIRCYHCGKNYKLKREKNVEKFICSGYDLGNPSCKKRIIIWKAELMEIINRRYEIRLNRKILEDELKDKLEYIIIEDRDLLWIKLKDFEDEIEIGRKRIIF